MLIPVTSEKLRCWLLGLPIRHGAQLAVDITLRSALTSCGAPRSNAAAVDGAVLTQARRDREGRYSEFVAAEQCCLVVVALETGGWWSAEASASVEEMAQARARDTPFNVGRGGESQRGGRRAQQGGRWEHGERRREEERGSAKGGGRSFRRGLSGRR